jgi:DNA-binding transcriptional regulator PaaX
VITGDQQDLVARLWDLDELRRRSDSHRRSLDHAATELEIGGDRALADVFVALAAAQQFLRVEPQLPPELTPDISGASVRSRYAEVVGEFQSQLGEFFGRGRPRRISTTAT